jgi:hypothetical protein
MICDLPKVNMWCAVTKNIIRPFYFEEHLVTGNKFLATMEETAMRHIPAETVFKLDGARSHFSHCVHGFLGREFPDHWKGGGRPIPWPLSSLHLILLDFTLFDICKTQRRKIWISCVKEQLDCRVCHQRYAHQYVVPLMASILRSNEHITNLVRCSLWRCIHCSFTLPDECYMTFYFIDI